MEYLILNVNPKNKKTSDCVLRAISFALGQDYVETYRDMVEHSIKTGYFLSDKKGYKSYLKSKGYEIQKMPKKDTGKRYTVAEFCDIIAENNKTYIISVANHLTVIRNKVLYDIWNCGNKSVGNYWVLDTVEQEIVIKDKAKKKQNKKRILL